MQKTLGGDRLGSGKKMKVDLHNYERSTHDIGYVWRSTMSAGTLVPFMDEVALPGTTFDINLGCEVMTHPTIGPLFGSYKVQLDVFLVPIRLYNSKLHNNALGVGRQMSNIKLPQIELTIQPDTDPLPTDIDNSQINPSCILSYLGIRGAGRNTDDAEITRQFNAISILGYWEIYKNYYANKQEEIGAVIHTPSETLVNTVDTITIDGNAIVQAPGTSNQLLDINDEIVIAYTGTPPIGSQIILEFPSGSASATEVFGTLTDLTGTLVGTYDGHMGYPLIIARWRYIESTDLFQGVPLVETFPLVNLDTMREEILATDGTTTFVINTTPGSIIPYVYLGEQTNTLSTQEGLGVKTYQSDLFNNWLKTENIEAISTATAIDTSGGSFTIDQFVISRKVWNMLNRINVSGGSYDDWLDAVYVHEKFKTPETPMYMGGLIKELVFQEVVSNSESGGQPLGTLAGKGTMANKHKGGTVVIHVDEPSMVMGIVSLTPRVDYSQGNKWHVQLKTMDDFHKPALDEIGFQDLITEQMAWWQTVYNGTDWILTSAGKQPAWLNYMTNVNKTYGNFAISTNEMFMTLNRRYENNAGAIGDLTTYIDPSKFNFIFAETAIDAQNFWVQIGVDITARRKMSGKLMPNL